MPRKSLKTGKTKRYNLTLPEGLFNEIQELADSKGTTVLAMLRKFIRLGLIVSELEDEPNSRLIIRTDDTEKEVILI